MSSPPPLCLYCGQRAGIIWVHGHGQCAHCKVNVDECCRGETAQLVATPKEKPPSGKQSADFLRR